MHILKKVVFVIGLLMISVVYSGCNLVNNKNTNQEQIHSKLLALKSYKADTTITFFENTQKNVIGMHQAYAVDGKYELTVTAPKNLEGHIITYDGTEITEFNPSTKEKAVVKPSVVRNQILFGTFVHNYLQSEDVAITVQKIDGENSTVLETIIPGNYKYLATQKVWFDQKTALPLKMIIYDKEGKSTIQVEFKNFEYNS